MNNIGISTDCVCDLPDEYLKIHDVDIVYFYITTDTGRFRDGLEITSLNILEYLENGGRLAETNAPAPEEYRDFFLSQLEKHQRLIHISISDGISNSYRNAKAALELMGEKSERVCVIDSAHLSTGMGHMVIKAVEMRDAGCAFDEITAAAEQMKPHISTSFMTFNTDYLYRNGRVSKTINKICRQFVLRPVLAMKNGKLGLKSIGAGNYDKAVIRYVKREMRHSNTIDKKQVFITHAGCPLKLINEIKNELEKTGIDEIIVTKASATVSSNCGKGSVGVLFVRN